MPIPTRNTNEPKSKFLNRCISFLINEGTPKEQAIAICMNKASDVGNEMEMELEPKPILNEQNLITGIYEGVWVASLPQELFNYQYLNIEGGVAIGYGLPIDFAETSYKQAYAKSFKGNIEFFSGAKTKQQTKLLNELVFDERGKKNTFKVFQEKALQINNEYNLNYLRTEMNTAFAVAQSAERWQGIVDEKDIFPLLQYQTMDDGLVRPEHKAWDNVILPVNDPFWRTHMPPNGWNCRCIVLQLTDGQIISLRGKKAKVDKGFDNNPGESGTIFKKTGIPYERNFEFKKLGLETPTDEKVKELWRL